jgi:cytochrome P450
MNQQNQQMVDFVGEEILEHERTLDKDNIRDYVDGFLVERDRVKGQADNTFSLDMLSGNIRGFFSAGSDTVRTVLEWLFLTIAVRQDVQEKIYKEIEEVIGHDKQPTWSDRLNMPYTQCVIDEIQRWKTIVPLNLPRRTLADITVQGVNIPANTQLLANFYSVHHDPKIYEEPEQFKPERFLDESGNFVKREEFLAFSYGKRSCPGESLAVAELFLYTTCIVRSYRLTVPEGIEPDFTESLGITSQPRTPVELIFTRR